MAAAYGVHRSKQIVAFDDPVHDADDDIATGLLGKRAGQRDRFVLR